MKDTHNKVPNLGRIAVNEMVIPLSNYSGQTLLLPALPEATDNQPREGIVISMDLYNKLRDAKDFLECLEAHGVDNWPGYGEAKEEFNNVSED